MNKNNSLKLITAFPKLYKENKVISCGDGWFQILWELSRKIEKEIERIEKQLILADIEGQRLPFMTDVKEKYGTLRFYMSCETETITEAINAAEDLTKITCEICGQKGMIREGRWIKVRCDQCEKSRGE